MVFKSVTKTLKLSQKIIIAQKATFDFVDLHVYSIIILEGSSHVHSITLRLTVIRNI